LVECFDVLVEGIMGLPSGANSSVGFCRLGIVNLVARLGSA